jgi:hypothetical protein
LESELEIFQSQFEQERGRSSNSENLMERRDNNLKFDSMSSRLGMKDPMAVMEREEQYSIDVDGER